MTHVAVKSPLGSAPATGPVPPLRVITSSNRIDLHPIQDAAANLDQAIKLEPSFPPMVLNQSETLRPHVASSAQLISSLRYAVNAQVTLGAYLRELNKISTPNESRHEGAGAACMPLAILNLSNRVQAGGAALSDGEDRLLRVFSASSDQSLSFPDWFMPARHFVALGGQMSDLPGPDVYLEKSESAAEKYAPLRGKLQQLEGEYDNLRKSKGPSEDITIAASTKMSDCAEALDSLLASVQDVKPQFIPECCQRVEVAVFRSVEITRALLNLHNSLANVIQFALNHDQPATGVISNLEVPELLKNPELRLGRYKLDLKPFKEAPLSGPELALVLDMYAQIRRELIEANAAAIKHFSREQAHRTLLDNLSRALQSLLPGDSNQNQLLLDRLIGHPNEKVQEAVVKLLVAKVTLPDSLGHTRQGTIIELPANVHVLGRAIKSLICGSEAESAPVKDALMMGAMKPALDFALSIRNKLEKRDYRGVCQAIDDEIVKLDATKASYAQRAALMLSIIAVVEDKDARFHIKGNIKNFQEIIEIAKLLTNDMAGSGTMACQFVESLRARISKSVSFDLSDYWGQRSVVDRWKGQLTNHLLLLSDPEAWAGCTANEAFINGYLLYGLPGVGKTFLVKCMATELDLALSEISREEMSAAFSSVRKELGGKSGAPDENLSKVVEKMESVFANFLSRKIDDLKASMKKSGAKGCMLLIDEMEAEFVERTMLTDSPAQMAMTNSMLRVIEAKIANHPEIIFVGATNHIDMVDSAALRLGRFGVHIKIGSTERADVEAIVDRTLSKQRINLGMQNDEAAYSALISSAIGMIPAAIKTAITNHCCVTRALARRSGEEFKVSLPDLQGAIDAMKAMGHKPEVEASKAQPAATGT